MLGSNTNTLIDTPLMPNPATPLQQGEAPVYRSRVLIVGGGLRAKEVYHSLEDTSLHRVIVTNFDSLWKWKDAHPMAIILVEPIDKLEEDISIIKSSLAFSKVSLIVVSRDNCSDERARNLYDLGVNSVVAFPKEKPLFSALFREMQKKGPQFQTEHDMDCRISKAIWARAKLVMNSMKKIKIWSHDGLVYIFGKVPSLAKKEQLEEMMVNAPGVEKLVLRGIKLSYTKKTDKELSTRIANTIQSTPGASLETLSHKVNKGKVVIAGHIKSKETLRRLTKNLQGIFGVRSIRNLATISKNRWEVDKKHAKEIKDCIKKFLILSDIQVTVMENVAVIKGYVDGIAKKKMVEELAYNHKPIDQVINHIEVSSSRTLR